MIQCILLLSQLLLSACAFWPRLNDTGQQYLGSTDDAVFTIGSHPVDDTGQQIHAHEGWILQIEDSYLWYGSSQKVNTSSQSGSWDWVSGSINLYVSHDLSTWHRKATVFSAASLPAAKLLSLQDSGPYRMERPKVLYNSARRYYVLIFHLDNIDGQLGQVGWAVSVSPYGPFKFEQASQPDSLPSMDLSVATDDAGDAYLVRSVPGASISISRLTRDYLDTTGVCTSIQHGPTTIAAPATHAAAAAAAGLPARQMAAAGAAVQDIAARRVAAAGAAAAAQGTAGWPQAAAKGAASKRAAPCLFSFQGKWYLLANVHGGWLPSAPLLYVSGGPNLCGAIWTQLQHPAVGPGGGTAFDSTPAFVWSYTFPGTSQTLPIYFGDRWNEKGPGSVGNASYVWLPLVPLGSPPVLQLVNPGEKWRLGDYRPTAPT